LPRTARPAPGPLAGATVSHRQAELAAPTRAGRTAAAMAAQQRRDTVALARAAAALEAQPAGGDRRAVLATLIKDRGVPATEVRLGQGARRQASPRAARSGVRSAS